MSELLKAEGIRHGYQGRTVLELASLELNKGEVLGLIGSNGAGKSTLVRILNLVERPDAGRIWFEGRMARTGDLELRRRMAAVFQKPYMFRGSVAKNVAYGLKLRGLPAKVIKQRVAVLLRLLDLAHLAGSEARRLSGGEAQRVALARAAAVQPEILFLDEPASNLDPPAAQAFHRGLKKIVQNQAVAVIYVTHDVSEAQITADRIALLRQGRLEQCGPAAEVHRAPATGFAARFLGVENIWTGRAVAEAAVGAMVELKTGKRLYSQCQVGGNVVACLRGEEVTLHPLAAVSEMPLTANRFPGSIAAITPTGAAFLVEVDCGFTVKARVAPPALRSLGLFPGAAVEVRFDKAAVHLIPAKGAGSELQLEAVRREPVFTGG